MKRLIYLVCLLLAIMCSSEKSNKEGNDIIGLGVDSNRFVKEVEVSSNNFNVFIFKNEKKIIDYTIKSNSRDLEEAKNILKILYSSSSKVKTSIYLIREGNEKVYLNDTYDVREAISNFNSKLSMNENFRDNLLKEIKENVNKENYEFALSLSEIYVYSTEPFPFRRFKDDRGLKIIQQKSLFESGKKREAILNILKIE